MIDDTNDKDFMDRTEFLYLLKQELMNTNLVFQSVDSSILNFSTNLPIYLNTPSEVVLTKGSLRSSLNRGGVV